MQSQIFLFLGLSAGVSALRLREEPKAINPQSSGVHDTALFYLVGPDRINELEVSLKSACKNIEGNYAVVLFHGSLLNSQEQAKLMDSLASSSSDCNMPEWSKRIEWVRAPKFDADATYKPNFARTKSSRTRDYGMMIEFWLKQAVVYAQEHRFKYIMRLDTDSIIASKPKTNLFEQVKNANAVYGYRGFCYENMWFSPPEKVWPVLREYVQTEGLKVSPEFQQEINKQHEALPLFYSNFEILDVDFFARPDVMKFSSAKQWRQQDMRKDGPLGDAVIRALQIGLFGDGKVAHLNDFKYIHGKCQECSKTDLEDPKWKNYATEVNDSFVMEWGKSSNRFGTPGGHCRNV